MPFKFEASKAFWKHFDKLNPQQQAAARDKFQTFKKDPFSPSLRPHKINRLTALLSRTVYAVDIEGDLRVTFYQDGQTIMSVSIGTHDIYK
jgi:hypothetical protein